METLECFVYIVELHITMNNIKISTVMYVSGNNTMYLVLHLNKLLDILVGSEPNLGFVDMLSYQF